MIKYLCAQLAKCFNAHLTEDEKLIRQKVEAARQALRDFNAALDAIPNSVSGTLCFKKWGTRDFITMEYFRLDSLKVSINNRKEL